MPSAPGPRFRCHLPDRSRQALADYEFLRPYLSFMTLSRFWGILVRYFAEYPSAGICLIIFPVFWDYGFGGEEGKAEVPCSPGHMDGMSHQHGWSPCPRVHSCPFLTLCFVLATLLSGFSLLFTGPWTSLAPKPEQTLKWRRCPTQRLFLRSAGHTETPLLLSHTDHYPYLPRVLAARVH